MFKILMFLNVILVVVGQFMLKIGMNKIGGFSSEKIVEFFTKAAFSPFIILGTFLYVVSLALWLVVLSKVELSLAYPIMSLSYVLVVVASIFVLNESFSIYKFLGVSLIVIGVVFIFKS